MGFPTEGTNIFLTLFALCLKFSLNFELQLTVFYCNHETCLGQVLFSYEHNTYNRNSAILLSKITSSSFPLVDEHKFLAELY
jgi:hypothetical protein